MKKLKIVYRLIDDLRPRPNNPRTHSRKQIRMIARSIEQFGFLSALLVDDESCIICGHGRWLAAKQLGLAEAPTVLASHLTAAEIRAYVIADNELAAQSGWDKDLLAAELTEIALIDPDFDLTLTGFELDRIELLQDIAAPKVKPPLAASGIDRARQPVTRLGDLWRIGNHRLLCGDALQSASYVALLGKERADLVITDPPFNVPIVGHVCSTRHREFVQASGEMSREQFERFLRCMLECFARFSRSGSLHYIFMDWRSIADLIHLGEEVYDVLLNVIVWAKTNAGMGSFYRSQHELVALFRHGRRPHRNRIELGTNGRHRSNVWRYPGANTFSGDRAADLALHPTVKNLDMITDAIKDASDPGDIVLDAFGGSGTTLLAAAQCGRLARLMELDPLYCDVILERAISLGIPATLSGMGQPYDEVVKERETSASGDEPASEATA